jgi:uncharacterized protein YuzE
MTYYDRQADIVYVELVDDSVAQSIEHGWGLIDVNSSGQTVGFECWTASQRFPAELLDALPQPAEDIPLRQPA